MEPNTTIIVVGDNGVCFPLAEIGSHSFQAARGGGLFGAKMETSVWPPNEGRDINDSFGTNAGGSSDVETSPRLYSCAWP